jgi:hypothetical protein
VSLRSRPAASLLANLSINCSYGAKARLVASHQQPDPWHSGRRFSRRAFTFWVAPFVAAINRTVHACSSAAFESASFAGQASLVRQCGS